MNTPTSRLSGLGTIGDFTASPRMLIIAVMATAIGLCGAGFAVALLKLIAFFTNVFFYQRLTDGPASPANHQLGAWVILVPVIGAAIVGLMARYGSERIRGHGIPEALESILLKGSRTEPKLVILKPISTAISIGSGGPFGAEGPIIMTAGSFGSLVAQLFHLTDAERKTLLVAGAAAGMSATFASPFAATLLAVELLLFEWKPRSLVPVALASIAAFAARIYLLGPGPLFPTPPHPAFIGVVGLLACLVAGLAVGLFSAILTTMVYWSEDAFAKLPIHWMWWPPIGGLIVGLGGWIFPTALGVGYETIGALLQGHLALGMVLGVVIVKSIIWSVSLGSGTSGGVLAPLLMMGGALGALGTYVLPQEGPGFWPLICLAAMLGGTMRAPFTAVVFALELTHDYTATVPVLLAAVVAHAFTVLVLPRSILTEKVARRGHHLSREYTVDPLEIMLARAAMTPVACTLRQAFTFAEVQQALAQAPLQQRLIPVVDEQGRLVGARGRAELEQLKLAPDQRPFEMAPPRSPVVIPSNAPLRVAAYRMAETGLRCLIVVRPEDHAAVVGLLSIEDLLKARGMHLDSESRRERPLRLWHIITMFSNSHDGAHAESHDESTPAPH